MERPMPLRDFYGWKLLSALWAVVFINLAFPIYGSRVVDAVMMQDLHLDRQTLGSIYSLFTIMSGLPGPLVALCVERFGIRFTLVSGSFLIVTGSCLMAAVVNTGLLAALAFGIIVGTGVAMGGVIGAQVGLARWFVRRRAFTLAILSSASGVGGFIAAPLLNQIIVFGEGNWRAGWWFMAALSCFAAVIALLFVKEAPADLGQLPDGAPADTARSQEGGRTKSRLGAVHLTTETWTHREALYSPFFWFMMVCQMGMSCGYVVFLGHGVVHLMDLGHTREAGSWAVSMIALAGLLAKGIVAVFGDRIDPRYIWASFIAIFGIGQILIVQADTPALLVMVASCFGIGFGGGVVCLAAVLSNYYGTKAFASLSGLAIAVNTTMGAAAPFVAGRLYDRGYGYQGVFYTIALWCFAGAALLFVARPPVKKTSPGYLIN